ncbi:esterase/lipase family protein [Actinomycetota bacterium Odt1-20B]
MAACVLAATVTATAGAGAVDGGTMADPVSKAKKLATPFLPGANDWSCKPGAKHPRPLVLVHGTLSLREEFLLTAPLYKKAGYCLFALDYGREPLTGLFIGGTGPMVKSAKELAVFIDGVLAATGTRQVDIVGYSQGGVLPRQYMKPDPGSYTSSTKAATPYPGSRTRSSCPRGTPSSAAVRTTLWTPPTP